MKKSTATVAAIVLNMVANSTETVTPTAAEQIAAFLKNEIDLTKACVEKMTGEPYNKHQHKDQRVQVAAMSIPERLKMLGFKKSEIKAAMGGDAVTETTAEKVEVVTTPVTELPVGTVMRYASSKKPYIVTEEIVGGRFLFSLTQKFAAKKEFPVVVLEMGTGVLPEKFEDEALNTLLEAAKADLAERVAGAEKAQKEKAAKIKAADEKKLAKVKPAANSADALAEVNKEIAEKEVASAKTQLAVKVIKKKAAKNPLHDLPDADSTDVNAGADTNTSAE